jgi:hypothetical protein
MSGWTLADLNFVRGLERSRDGHPCSGTQWSQKYNMSDMRRWECAGNAFFFPADLHRIPGAGAGESDATHIMADNTLGKFWLGRYGAAAEMFDISPRYPDPVQVLSLEGGTFWAVGGQGPDPTAEASRLFAVG